MISSEQVAQREETIRKFHELYYNDYEHTWETTRFLGHKVLKNPCDLWIYQEIIFGAKPDLIIETGTAHGGSALYLASLCDLVGKGMVTTIDIIGSNLYPDRPRHPRLRYLRGDSTDPDTRTKVESQMIDSSKIQVMVILDSEHKKEHVLRELDIWAPLASRWLIVEDTNINGRPVVPEHGPGPAEALEEWLPLHPEFQPVPMAERYMLTFNPGGYLQRV